MDGRELQNLQIVQYTENRNIFIFVSISELKKYKAVIFSPHKASPIAERSKSSDRGQGDPRSNPSGGRNFSAFFRDGELSRSHIVCFNT